MVECHQQWGPPTRGNNISLHAWRGRHPHPHFEKKGKGGKQRKYTRSQNYLLRKLFFDLEYSSEISTNTLTWMELKSVSKFSGCPSLGKKNPGSAHTCVPFFLSSLTLGLNCTT